MAKYSPVWRKELNAWMSNPHTSSMSDAMKVHAANNRHRPKVRESKMCQACGAVSIIGGDRLRESNESKHGAYYCDTECAESDRGRVYRTSPAYRAKINAMYENKGLKRAWEADACELTWAECNHCGKQFSQRHGRQSCSGACRDANKQAKYEQSLLRKRISNAPKRQSRVLQCEYCKATVEINGWRVSSRKWCSDKCQIKATKQRRDHWVRTNGPCEYISLDKLIKKFKGRCVECHCKVVKQTGEYQDNGATIDHIVPLSKGGWHTWNNVQLMCHKCNGLKADDVAGKQLMLPMSG